VTDSKSFMYGKAEESPGFLLWQVTTLWKQRLEAVLSGFGITHTQHVIMASLLWLEGGAGVTQARLAAHTKIDKMTLSKAIRKLEAAKLVSRCDSRTDGRAFYVGLSSAGKAVARKAVPAVEKADEEFFSGLPPAQRCALLKTLVQLSVPQDAVSS